ncbi:MAG: zf-HC2 domain-containing protein [Clostridiales bacterium]|nr:zf-HC2 domain-containing protein [Clostridiales bacterium]
MRDSQLDCCVVRDLLQGYIENLTEAETAQQVEKHLAICPQCSALEQNMKKQVSATPVPQQPLRFLGKIKRIRLFSALLAAAIALLGIFALYESEFHYENTQAGRLEALMDFLPSSSDSGTGTITEETPLSVVAYGQTDHRLFLFFSAENKDRVHGMMHLVKGLNGKYRIVNASYTPFPYTQGVYTASFWGKGTEDALIVIAGDSCRDIYSAKIAYWVNTGTSPQVLEKTYPLKELNFLWLKSQEDLQKELGLSDSEIGRIDIKEVFFLDQKGTDITEQFFDPSVTQSWSSSKSKAEMGLLYVYMAIAAILGAIFVRYFLKE